MHVENSLSQESCCIQDSVENVANVATRMNQLEKHEIQKEFCHSLDSILHDPRVSKEQILNFQKNDYCKRQIIGRNFKRLWD